MQQPDISHRSDHARIEDRSVALHRRIAEKLRANPQLLSVAHENLRKWRKSLQTSAFDEWEALLRLPLDELLSALVDRNEVMTRLRQSSPFAGILTPKERWKIYESYTTRAYSESSGNDRRG